MGSIQNILEPDQKEDKMTLSKVFHFLIIAQQALIKINHVISKQNKLNVQKNFLIVSFNEKSFDHIYLTSETSTLVAITSSYCSCLYYETRI
jgi:hypothetical protein